MCLLEFCAWLVCHPDELEDFRESRAEARRIMTEQKLSPADQALLLGGDVSKIKAAIAAECPSPAGAGPGPGNAMSVVHGMSLVMPTN